MGADRSQKRWRATVVQAVEMQKGRRAIESVTRSKWGSSPRRQQRRLVAQSGILASAGESSTMATVYYSCCRPIGEGVRIASEQFALPSLKTFADSRAREPQTAPQRGIRAHKICRGPWEMQHYSLTFWSLYHYGNCTVSGRFSPQKKSSCSLTSSLA